MSTRLRYTGAFRAQVLLELGREEKAQAQVATEQIFETPQDQRTDDYIRERFGWE